MDRLAPAGTHASLAGKTPRLLNLLTQNKVQLHVNNLVIHTHLRVC